MQTLQEAMSKRIGAEKKKVRGEVFNSLFKLEKLIEHIEKEFFNPKDATSELGMYWNKQVTALRDRIYGLQDDYKLFPEMVDFLQTVDGEVDKIVKRFWKWADREIVTVKEAAEMIGRSRWTVYRWIKAGKLIGQKVGRCWQIIAP